MVVADQSHARHAVHVMYQDFHSLAAALEAGHASQDRQPSLQALQYWPLAFACKKTCFSKTENTLHQAKKDMDCHGGSPTG